MIKPIGYGNSRHENLTKGIVEYLQRLGDMESAKHLGYINESGEVTDKGYKEIMPLAVRSHKKSKRKNSKHNPLEKLFKN